MKPRAIPVATLKVSGIMMIVTNEGIITARLLQLILLISVAINAPTIMSAGAVTSGVMTDRIGEKSIATPKHAAMITEVKPVRPPTAMPADDSTKDAVVEVPSTAPATADPASASSARPALGILLSFIRPAWLATAISAPAVSKKATNKNVKMTARTSGEDISNVIEDDTKRR